MPVPFSNPQSTRAPDHAVAEKAKGKRISPGPYIGIVMNNIDSMRSGRMQVWIAELGGDKQDQKSWKTVSYCSPFFGVTPSMGKDGARTADDQSFTPGSPHSYGMWFVPPDVGVQVMCIFVNGDPFKGYWFGCIPDWPNMHMVPGISSGSWHGAGPEPLVDYNQDQNAAGTDTFYKRAATVHDYQQQVWSRQGLLSDPDRGPGISSAFRESPSRVFGISTPGPELAPYGDNVLGDNVDLRVAGRQGGHQFVMDDGTIDGKSQLIRLRTSNGNMLLMNDSAGFIYLINSTGSAWFEMDKTGNVRIYSQGEINMHATTGFTFETPGAVKLSGSTIDIAGTGGVKISGSSVDINGASGVKVGGSGGLDLSGSKVHISGKQCVGITASGHIDMKGSCITLNTTKPTEAAAPAKASPGNGPTHEPYSGHQASATNNPVSTPSYGSISGVPSGKAGSYGAAASFGATPNNPAYYGAYTNATGPIKFNTGFQGSFAGQAANQGETANLSVYDKYAVSYTNVNLKLPVASAGFAINVTDENVKTNKILSVGEKQNNPADLDTLLIDPYAIGQNNGLNVYSTPEDGIAALSVALDLIQQGINGSSPAVTIADFIAGYFGLKGDIA